MNDLHAVPHHPFSPPPACGAFRTDYGMHLGDYRRDHRNSSGRSNFFAESVADSFGHRDPFTDNLSDDVADSFPDRVRHSEPDSGRATDRAECHRHLRFEHRNLHGRHVLGKLAESRYGHAGRIDRHERSRDHRELQRQGTGRSHSRMEQH